jgi:hypothetical protein
MHAHYAFYAQKPRVEVFLSSAVNLDPDPHWFVSPTSWSVKNADPDPHPGARKMTKIEK